MCRSDLVGTDSDITSTLENQKQKVKEQMYSILVENSK